MRDIKSLLAAALAAGLLTEPVTIPHRPEKSTSRPKNILTGKGRAKVKAARKQRQRNG